jgi:nitroreductase
MAACPSRSVQVKGFNYTEFGPIPKELLSTDELHDFLRSRRSIRFYKEQPVPADLVDQIIEVASCAPMGAPPSHVEVLTINDQDLIRKEVLPRVMEGYKNLIKWSDSFISRYFLKRQVGKDMMIALENYLIPLVREAIEIYNLEETDCLLWDPPAIMLFHADRQTLCCVENCVIASVYARLAAESLGLGCCLNGIAPPIFDMDPELRKRFNIPEKNKVVLSFTFGYPRFKFQRTTPWKFSSVKIF